MFDRVMDTSLQVAIFFEEFQSVCFSNFYFYSIIFNWEKTKFSKTLGKIVVPPEDFPTLVQKQPQEVFYKKSVLKKVAKFTRKHLCQSLQNRVNFIKKVNLVKKETLARVFSYEFCEIFENTYFIEHSGRPLLLVWRYYSGTLHGLCRSWF